MISSPAPVALFIYNRPAHTARTLAALAANPLASETDLTIFADGPKSDSQTRAVEETRNAARKAAGFRTVRIIERAENFGLARSIITGVAQLCDECGRAIVVEDDLLVAPTFLGFLNAGLQRYENDDRVMQVSGYAFPIGEPDGSYFLPIISCWGWATWGRAWKHFDPEMGAFAELRSNAQLQKSFNLGGAYDYWGMACSQRAGSIDSWGIRWQMSLFGRGGLVLYPPKSLVENFGVDSTGTHGSGQAGLQKPVNLDVAQAGWRWPSSVEIDRDALEATKALLRSQQPSIARATLSRIMHTLLPPKMRAVMKSVLKPRPLLG